VARLLTLSLQSPCPTRTELSLASAVREAVVWVLRLIHMS
jgi:hypothetical protein